MFTVPGAPSNVSFPDVTSTTARVIWDVPVDPNGEILAYRINYQLHSSEGYNFSKEFRASDRTFRYLIFSPNLNSNVIFNLLTNIFLYL